MLSSLEFPEVPCSTRRSCVQAHRIEGRQTDTANPMLDSEFKHVHSLPQVIPVYNCRRQEAMDPADLGCGSETTAMFQVYRSRNAYLQTIPSSGRAAAAVFMLREVCRQVVCTQ
jgi:hypothetical protein